MTNEQAVFLRDQWAAAIDHEIPTTRRVLAAVPEDRKEYRPAEKNKTAFELALHIATSEAWFLDGVINGQFGNEEPPTEAKTIAEVLDWYDKNVPARLARLRETPAEKLVVPVNFFNIANEPAVTYLHFLIIHSVHHRGQLSAYLRPMGAKVPSIYGGSADEPFEMPTAQAG
jgi:uncharacterized damage-inducible protein DinB